MFIYTIAVCLCAEIPHVLAIVTPLNNVFSDTGVIASIGVDGSGYKEYKTGDGSLQSFAYGDNLLIWATLNGDVKSKICLLNSHVMGFFYQEMAV